MCITVEQNYVKKQKRTSAGASESHGQTWGASVRGVPSRHSDDWPDLHMPCTCMSH